MIYVDGQGENFIVIRIGTHGDFRIIDEVTATSGEEEERMQIFSKEIIPELEKRFRELLREKGITK